MLIFIIITLAFSPWYFTVVLPPTPPPRSLLLSPCLSSPVSLQGGWILVLAPDPMWKLVIHIPRQFTLVWESQAQLHLRWGEWLTLIQIKVRETGERDEAAASGNGLEWESSQLGMKLLNLWAHNNSCKERSSYKDEAVPNHAHARTTAAESN